MAGTTRDAQHAMQSISGVEPVSSAVPPRGAPGTHGGPGVTWQIPSSVVPGQMAPYPHATGPRPGALPGTIGAGHHLTTTRTVPLPAGAAFEEIDASGGRRASSAAHWRLAERLHLPVLEGGAVGEPQRDQYLAISAMPGADGLHQVRSVGLALDERRREIATVSVRIDSGHQPVSPRSAIR